jgi:cell division cycle protein 20 (cofactor of APC complex)
MYPEAPPAAPEMTLREIACPFYNCPDALASSLGVLTNLSRKIATQPEQVLNAPGMVHDFHLNLLSWSMQNVVMVALLEHMYVWRADTGAVVQIGEAPEGTYVSSVDFFNDGAFPGIGIGSGKVELCGVEPESEQKLRSMSGHLAP